MRKERRGEERWETKGEGRGKRKGPTFLLKVNARQGPRQPARSTWLGLLKGESHGSENVMRGAKVAHGQSPADNKEV